MLISANPNYIYCDVCHKATKHQNVKIDQFPQPEVFCGPLKPDYRMVKCFECMNIRTLDFAKEYEYV